MSFLTYSYTVTESMSRANEWAKNLGSDYIVTEHLLLGLMDSNHPFLRQCDLNQYNIELSIRRELEALIDEPEPSIIVGKRIYTPRTKQALHYAEQLALNYGHSELDVEHILYGLVREHEGLAARVLEEHTLTLNVLLGELERFYD